MKRLKVMLAIAISIAMITGCGKAASGNNTGQSADGSTGQTATESGEKEEELSVGKSGGALQEGINSLYGIGGAELDVAHAREFFTKAAEGGDARAHTYLARIHRIDANNSLAVEKYQKAIELGDDLAKVDLGYMYLGDQGVKIDTHKAMDLFEEAWESGCAEAVFGIGLLYEDDRFEVSMNKEKAIQYFEIASQSDDPYTAALAYQELAEVYNSGEDADIDKALENLEKANAIQKHWTGDSLRAEGDMLSEAGRKSEAEECYKKAAEIYELNAEKGMPCLWCQAGYIYLKCLDPDQNTEKAFECLNKAAEAGIALGWSYTGFAYSAGAGVEKDKNKAVEYFTKAAEAGEANAQTALGTLYIDGEEVEADLQLGKEYIEAAVDQGSTKALVMKGGYLAKAEPELFDSDPMMVFECLFDAYNSDDKEVRHYIDEGLQQTEDEVGVCLKPWKLTDKKNSGKLEGDWQVYGQGLKDAENENMLSSLMMEGYSALFAKGTKVSFGEDGNMQIGPLGGKYSPAGEHQIDISDQENKLRVEWGYARFDSDVLLLNFDFSGGSGLQVQLKTPEKIEEENRRKEAEAAAWEAKNSEEDGTD